ncbi:MAG: RHS repeat protein [Acidobacteria bacterium]|nr:RHS repeat protein [Acidobacteriota bacterium]
MIGDPLVPDLLQGAAGRSPFLPLDRDPTEGLRHGFVQTSSGRLGFEVTDLELPSRIPIRVGRVYDAGLRASIPGVPFEQNPRLERDLGINWLLMPSSVMILTGTGFLMITDEGGVIPYALDPGGSGKYLPQPNRPLRFGPLEPVPGDAKYIVRMTDGRVRTYAPIPGEPYYWVRREEDASGNRIDFEYDLTYLKRVVSSDGAWVELHRPLWGEPAPPGTPNSRVMRMTDSAGREVRFTYDAQFRLASVSDADGGTWDYSYDSAHHITTIDDPLRRQLWQIATNGSHRATSVTIGVRQTTYSYSTGQTTVTEGGGSPFVYSYGATGMTSRLTNPDGGFIDITRHPTTGDVTRIVDAENGQHDFEHDTAHRITRYLAPSVSGERAEWRYERDSVGRLRRVVLPTGARSELIYDALGRVVGEGVDEDADGTHEYQTAYVRDSVHGDIAQRVDGEGRITNYTYTALGQVAEVRPPCTDEDADGTAEHCVRIKIFYDAAGRRTELHWPSGPGTWAVWRSTWTDRGVLASLVDPLERTWTITSNAVGEVTRIQDPVGTTTTLTWNPDRSLASVENGLGELKSWDYDAAGRLSAFIDASGARWEFDHDPMGRLVGFTDPESRFWSFGYDRSGRRTRTTMPSGADVLVEFDALGRPVRRTLGDGAYAEFDWSSLGLLESAAWFPGSSAAMRHRWSWSWSPSGLITSLAQEMNVDGASGVTTALAYDWDRSGKLAGFTRQDGRAFTVSRDAWGRPRTVRSDLPSIVEASISYDIWTGRVVQRHHGKPDIVETLSYDLSGAVTALREIESGVTLRDLEFTRDAMGRVTGIADLLPHGSGATSVSRDSLGRITRIATTQGDSTDLYWGSAGQLAQVAWEASDGTSDVERYAYDRSGLPRSTTSAQRFTSYEWDFAPADSGHAFEAKRLSFGPETTLTRLSYDLDSRIVAVDDLQDGNWTPRHRFEWSPTALPRPAWAYGFDDAGVLTSSEGFSLDAHAIAAGMTPEGVVTWQSSPLLMLESADAGSWRHAELGRADDELDEGRLIGTNTDSPIGLADRVGGTGVLAGLELLDVFAFGVPGLTRDFTTVAESRVTEKDVDPRYTDRSQGLPVSNDTIALPGWSSAFERAMASRGVPVLGIDGSGGQGLSGLRIPDMNDKLSNGRCSSPNVADCLARDSWAGPDFPPEHIGAREPLRNADIHPLGVTLSNGEFTLSVVDVSIPGRGIDLTLSRTYRSKTWHNGALGRGWILGLFDERVELADAVTSRYGWHRADGSLVVFPDPMQDQETPVGRSRMRSRIENGFPVTTIDLREQDGTVTSFVARKNGPYLPESISRPGASKITVEWHYEPPVFRPKSARLWSCDDDEATNPASHATCEPVEIGRFEFHSSEGESDGWSAVQAVDVIQDGVRRRLVYDLAHPATGSATLSTLTIALCAELEGDCSGQPEESRATATVGKTAANCGGSKATISHLSSISRTHRPISCRSPTIPQTTKATTERTKSMLSRGSRRQQLGSSSTTSVWRTIPTRRWTSIAWTSSGGPSSRRATK